ncbi:MAG: DUF1571 domain-containing protein [Candidatus Binatia bacterium]
MGLTAAAWRGASAALLWLGVAEAGPADERRFDDLVVRMEERGKEIRDYTCVMTKRERIGEELRPMETMFVKHRGPGVCLYMKWIAPPHEGREIVYCEGKYGGELQAHDGSGWTSWLTVSIDPKGSLAMRDSRRPVTEAGIFNTIRLVGEGFARGRRGGGGSLERVFDAEIHDRPATCAVARPDADEQGSGEPIGTIELCIDRELHLPALVRVRDLGERLLGEYGYRDYRLNVGLTDRDFDIENEDYDF